MSRPPTPVLDCPLVYLEIRDGASARACNSSQFNGIFTFTIEGQRRVDAEMGALIVLIRKEAQQVVSLRLPETREGLRPPSDMVSINKQVNRLCICVPGKPQAILVQFEKTRDFSVAVYLLHKAGFHISDTLPASLLTSPPAHNTTLEYGPLLSSITPPSLLPLNTTRGPETQHDLSFAAMLAHPSQHSQPSTISNPWVSHTQRYMSFPVQPYPVANQVVNLPPAAAQLNPYNMFLGRGNAYSHVSHVSSPLRHSVVPNSPSTNWPGNDIGAFSSPNMATPDLGFHDPVMHGNFGLISPENSQNNDVGSHMANGQVQKKTTDEPVHYQSPQNKSKEYRDLMPQPRTLPFESSKKGYKAGGSSKLQVTKQAEAVKSRKPRKTGTATQSTTRATANGPKKSQATSITRKEANVKQQKSSLRDIASEKIAVQSDSNHKRADGASTPPVKPSLPPKKSKQDTYEDAQCQTDMQPEPNGVGGSSKTTAFVEQSSDHDVSSLVVVTDPDTLRDLHEETAKLFEEYEKGVEDGGDQVRHTKLYLRQIWEKRRDFWLRQFRDNMSVQLHGQAGESLQPLDSAA
ncbi:unnamed protein product [Fusarium graminearum]|uniref:Chromosome 4, complete genome n=2 Tax=Gibberella zeae (strain ATCC MYA-4620 / CBS 123657 / FGSC 9075 / NRRL 31084 / PH-1) TaxID=229533 RepID=A0A1C3YLV8_GIBZE|nr:unnamed protein product [Fusarium graminearum]